MLLPPLAESLDIHEHHGYNGHQQQHRQRAGHAEIHEIEHLLVHAVGDDLGVQNAVGHHVHDIKDLQHVDDQGGGDHHDGGLDDGKRYPEEDLKLPGAIHARRLHDLLWNPLDARRQDDHGEPGPDPYAHHDQRPVVYAWIEQPCLWLEGGEQGGQHRVQRPDLGHALRLELVHELPDHPGRHEGDGHGQENEGFGRLLVSHFVGQYRDQQSHGDRDQREEDQPQGVVPQHDEHIPVGKNTEVVLRTDESGGVTVQEAQNQGVDHGIQQKNR